MLQNAYLIAKIGADTAENERKFAKIWQGLRQRRRRETAKETSAGTQRCTNMCAGLQSGQLNFSVPPFAIIPVLILEAQSASPYCYKY